MLSTKLLYKQKKKKIPRPKQPIISTIRHPFYMAILRCTYTIILSFLKRLYNLYRTHIAITSYCKVADLSATN